LIRAIKDDIEEIKMTRVIKGQRALEFRTWGGKRAGAGRPPKGPRSSERHKKRSALKAQHPVHVTLRVVPAVGRLRKRHIYRAIQRAMLCTLRRHDFRICHVSIQGNHIHLIVEADHERALARGMQGFEISAAKQINRELSRVTGVRRTGQVFADRYHAEPLTSPRQVRNALAYVLNNWRRHGEDRGEGRTPFDPFSSGNCCRGWKNGPQLLRLDSGVEYLPIAFPTTWLLETGWRRHGLLSPWERPGPAAPA